MSYLAFFAVLLVLAPTVITVKQEFSNKNHFGAIGIIIYLGLIMILAIYQIFLR